MVFQVSKTILLTCKTMQQVRETIYPICKTILLIWIVVLLVVKMVFLVSITMFLISIVIFPVGEFVLSARRAVPSASLSASREDGTVFPIRETSFSYSPATVFVSISVPPAGSTVVACSAAALSGFR